MLLSSFCRYGVEGAGQLDAALSNPAAAFYSYSDPVTKKFAQCSNAFTQSMVSVAETYPEDVNIAAIAAGALMEQPAWMWWQVGMLARVQVVHHPEKGGGVCS